MSSALFQTSPGGQITCIGDTPLGLIGTIDRSVTIDCTGTGSAMARDTASSTPTIQINVTVDSTVVLRGLNLNFARQVGGIDFIGAGKLVLENVRVAGGTDGGLLFRPSGTGKLVIVDSTFSFSGTDSTGAGILIKPQSGGTAQVTMNRVAVGANPFGIAIDGSASTGGINTTITDSDLASNSNDGVVATTSAGGAPIGVMLVNSRSVNNGFGVRSIGSNVTVRMVNSEIIGNGVGVTALGGGALLSGGNNLVQANATKGAFSGSFAAD